MHRRGAAVTAFLVALALPAGAAADGFEPLYRDFKDDGRIAACEWSDAELRSAERSIPADVEQYAPAFGEQIRVARQRRALGDCDTVRPLPAVAGVPSPPPAEIPADTGVDVPTAVSLLGWLIIVAAVVALIALALARTGAASSGGRGLRASIREAGEKAADLAREFWDWLRLGR